MKKTKKADQPSHDGKGFFALAGEAFSVLGDEIVEGKDKIVEVAAEKFVAVKKAIKKITNKKVAPARKVVKKKGLVKKAAKKVAKKAIAASRKVVPKKAIAAPKKAGKKAVKKAVKKSTPAKKKR